MTVNHIARKRSRVGTWLMLLTVPAVTWWLLGFLQGWGWPVLHMLPGMPTSLGTLPPLAAVAAAAYSALAWLRDNV